MRPNKVLKSPARTYLCVTIVDPEHVAHGPPCHGALLILVQPAVLGGHLQAAAGPTAAAAHQADSVALACRSDDEMRQASMADVYWRGA